MCNVSDEWDSFISTTLLFTNPLCYWEQKRSQKRFIFCLALNIPFECTLFNTFHFEIPNNKQKCWILQLVAAAGIYSHTENTRNRFVLNFHYIDCILRRKAWLLLLFFCLSSSFLFLFAFYRGNDNDSCLLFDKINWMNSSLRSNIVFHWRRENMIFCICFEVVHRIRNKWQKKHSLNGKDNTQRSPAERFENIAWLGTKEPRKKS